MNGYTWAVDGYGRCFVVRLTNIREILFCAFNPGGAIEFIHENSEEKD